MKLVVAGLCRTGTQSLVSACQLLGFETLSQEELLGDPDTLDRVLAGARGADPFDPALLGDATASIGWPLCFLYAEQLAHWPDAKCVLNVRDAEDWYASVARVWPVLSTIRKLPFPRKAKLLDGMVSLVEGKMGGTLDHSRWTDGYRRHIEEVRASVPADRLLVWEVGAGWDPICEFLDLPVPEASFPRGNSSKNGEFAKKARELIFGR